MAFPEPDRLRILRAHTSRAFVPVLWAHVPLLAAVAAYNHTGALVVGLIAAALAAVGTAAAVLAPGTLAGRLGVAYALTGMPMLLVHAGSGVWQIDYHMYFFAVFAMLAAYVDWRPIALAAGLTAAHHLVLDFVLPSAVFPQQSGWDGVPRVLLHAAVVVAECAVLFWMTARVQRVFAQAEEDTQRARAALDESNRLRELLAGEGAAKSAALADTQRALDDARTAAVAAQREEARRVEMERAAAQQRDAIVRELAGRLDASVRSVVDDVLAASQQMLASAREAERLASDTREEVDRVADITTSSRSHIDTAAVAAAQLAQSSAEILDRMRGALGVGERAVRESANGAALARSLTEAAERIDAVTALIEGVADQTRLLSLNAAIEAARAGDSGRGFAVVAEEVRKLAEATSTATGEIAEVVASMRRASHDVAAALGAIDASVGQLTSAATDVASSVEEQSAATQTIAEIVDSIAHGTTDVQRAVERMSDATLRVGTSAGEVLIGADAIVARNERLRENVGAVTRELRSADAGAEPVPA